MRLIAIFLIANLIASKAVWACTLPSAITLNPGDKVVDCQRIAVDAKVMSRINSQLITGDFNAQIVDEQRKVIQLKDLQLQDASKDRDLWKAESDRERGLVDKAEDRSSRTMWLGILAGIFLTVGAGWALGQVNK